MGMSVIDSLLVTALGMGVVFIVLVLLNLLIKGLSVLIEAMGWDSGAWANAQGTFVPAPGLRAPAAALVPDPGTGGELKLHGVDEKTAAIIMAIVAHRSGTPLNELRFRSIRLRND